MPRLEVKRQMGRGDIQAVAELLDVATLEDGHAPLGEHQWLDLVHGGRAGFAGLVAWEPGHDHPVGYAQITRGNEQGRSWAVEYVVDPHHRSELAAIAQTLLEAALGVVAEEGGGRVHLWVPKPGPDHDAVATSVGLARERELQQLRRTLPADDVPAPSIEVRPFVPGQDDDDWLAVNNRAFEGHPEQGQWDRQALADRQDQPWFDPSGFLLHERDRRLAGFCWTKIHPDDPTLGELYVVAVDPDFQGQKLGRELALAGLELLARRGVRTAMLYVDADNPRALNLYKQLGFTVDHVDRAYVGDISGD